MPILESLSPILYRFGNEANRVPFQNLTSYVDLIDDIKDEVSLYETYYVRDGDRPDQLSLKFYNTTDFYWTFFLMNDHVRVQGWPLSNYQLEKKVKEDFPNTIFTTRNNLTGIFKVGETVTGNTSGGSGVIIRRHLDLGQIVIKGDISFSSGETMTSSGGQSVTSTGFVREFNAVHHYEDANKKYIDIDKIRHKKWLKLKIPFNDAACLEVNIGDKVYAIGHPGGLPWTFSEGIINQIREKKVWDYPGSEYEHVATLIQTQTPINPGNSGGPLFSENGNLIGINTLKGPGENINFAVAVEHAVKFLNDNPQIKNMNPGELIMKKNYPKARTQDYNENGVVDTWYIDSNNNGIEDRALVDDDEDGFIEAVLYDENENGVWEAQYVDDDLDGKANRLVLDENEDKKPDVVGYDDDQDGKWDRFEKIS